MCPLFQFTNYLYFRQKSLRVIQNQIDALKSPSYDNKIINSMESLLSQAMPEQTQTHQFDNLLTTNNKNQLIQANHKSETQSKLLCNSFADQNLQNSRVLTKRMQQTTRYSMLNQQVTSKHQILNQKQTARKTSCKYRTIYRSLEGASRQQRQQKWRKSEKTEKAVSCNKKTIVDVKKLITQTQNLMDKAASKHEMGKDHCYSLHLQVIEGLKNVTIDHKFDALATDVRMFVHYNLVVAYLHINQLLGKLQYSQSRIHFHIQSFMRQALDSIYHSAALVAKFDINSNPNYEIYLTYCNILLFQGRQKANNISDCQKRFIYNYESYCHSTCIIYFAFIQILHSYSIFGQSNHKLLEWLQNMISDIDLTTNSIQKHMEKVLSEAGYVNTKLKREMLQLKRCVKDHIKQLGLNNNVCKSGTHSASEKFCHQMRDQHKQMKMQNFCVPEYEKFQVFRQEQKNTKLDRTYLQRHVNMCLIGQSYAVVSLFALFDSFKQAYLSNSASSFIQDSKDILRRALHLSQEYLKESQLFQQIKQKFLSLLQDQACIRQATKQQQSEQQDENQYQQVTLKEARVDTLQGEQLILDKLKRISASNAKQTRTEQMRVNIKNDLQFVVNKRTKMRSSDMSRSGHKVQLRNWSTQKDEGRKDRKKDNKVAQKIRQTYRRVVQQSSQTSRKQGKKKRSPEKLKHYLKDAISIRFSFEKATEEIKKNERIQNEKQVESYRNRKVLESRQGDKKIQDCEYFMQEIDTMGCQLLRKNQKQQRMVRIKEEKYRDIRYQNCS